MKSKTQSPTPILVLPLNTPLEHVERVVRAGYLPILTGNPDGVRLLSGHCQIDGNDLMMAALHAVANCSSLSAKENFIADLYARLKFHEAPKGTPKP